MHARLGPRRSDDDDHDVRRRRRVTPRPCLNQRQVETTSRAHQDKKLVGARLNVPNVNYASGVPDLGLVS